MGPFRTREPRITKLHNWHKKIIKVLELGFMLCESKQISKTTFNWPTKWMAKRITFCIKKIEAFYDEVPDFWIFPRQKNVFSTSHLMSKLNDTSWPALKRFRQLKSGNPGAGHRHILESSVAMLFWNNAFWLAKTIHMTCSSQSE